MTTSDTHSYIATFFSHYDALTFYNLLTESGITAKLASAPRKVSASCGTSVSFVTDSIPGFQGCEVEAIYIETSRGFSEVWACDD